MNSDARRHTTASAPKQRKQPGQITLEDFLKKESRAKFRHEFYNGIVTKIPMATGSHNIVVANTSAALVHSFIKENKPYLVFGSQQLIYLPALNFSLYPDVLVVAESPQYWDENEVLLLNPLLVIEVLSKSTRAYDRGEKFSEYKTIESFKEYLLIDPSSCRIESRFREEPNLWRENVITDLSESIMLRSVGCALTAAEVYRHVNFK